MAIDLSPQALERSEALRRQLPDLFAPPVNRVKETMKWEARMTDGKELSAEERSQKNFLANRM